MNAILTPRSGLVSLVVASAINNKVPVTAFSPNPAQISGKYFSSGRIGVSPGQKPSSTRSSMALPPATIDMPSVCKSRMVGNDQMVPDSRPQRLSRVCSSHPKNSSILDSAFLFPAGPFKVAHAQVDEITGNAEHGSDAENNRSNRQSQQHPRMSPR